MCNNGGDRREAAQVKSVGYRRRGETERRCWREKRVRNRAENEENRGEERGGKIEERG